MSLKEYATRELTALGLIGSDDEMNNEMGACVLKLIDVFSEQGHSGFSAGYCVMLFEKLASFKPLSPLSGNDSEWTDVSEQASEPLWQNKRNFAVFKDHTGKAYDIDAVYYMEPNYSTFTRGGARHYIEFPYTPKRQCIKVDFNGNPVTDDEFAIIAAKYQAENP